MHISKRTFQIVQITFITFVLLIFAIVAYNLITTNADEKARDATRKTSLTRFQTSAFAYHSRLLYFNGVCGAAGATAQMNCDDMTDAFAAEIQLTDGTYYCADSTRFRGVVKESKGTATQCPQ